ncbi:winged helix-turn-helix domain-containing protein [Enterobacter vonholyi]|uniref:winged helix-turn-helix domain-containing protein n=1 Tax=Enterobacter vonholyi TaxID=2797505 RepID=UPI0032B44EC6
MKIIEEKVIFISNESILKSLKDSSFSKKISTPCCRILNALILNEGEMIKYEQLYKIGWGENHMRIKPNTLYQNISILRRTFEDLGVEGKIIKTHPRSGISIDCKIDTYDLGNDIYSRNRSPPNNTGKNKVNLVKELIVFMCTTPLLIFLNLMRDNIKE